MNDLIQLKSDMETRYASVIHGRKSLQQLEKLVRHLTEALKMNAVKMIRPETPYWAALSNAVAGAVDEAQKLLDEAVRISTYPVMARCVFFFCLVVGFDADVKEIQAIFECINQVVAKSQASNGAQDLVRSLRRVNTLRVYGNSSHVIRVLSNIQEEPPHAVVA